MTLIDSNGLVERVLDQSINLFVTEFSAVWAYNPILFG